MTSHFRAPTSEMPNGISFERICRKDYLITRSQVFDVPRAETLLKVLLEVCPNARTIVDKWAQANVVQPDHEIDARAWDENLRAWEAIIASTSHRHLFTWNGDSWAPCECGIAPSAAQIAECERGFTP